MTPAHFAASFNNEQFPQGTAAEQLAAEVRLGLQKPQKELPSYFLYDAVGSALFDAITLLPEYGLTRADERLLERHSRQIAWRVPPEVIVAELGSGNGKKAAPVLAALSARQRFLPYYPIDLSPTALERCRHEISSMPGIRFQSVEQSYLDGLHEVIKRRLQKERLLVLYLGSSIGNFTRHEAINFLKLVRRLLQPGDAVLIGADLIKPVEQLLAAYDDPAGVTAAFNQNLLCRINRELDADFKLRNFSHEARWSASSRRIEMHLRALTRQSVNIPGADCRVSFDAGETIWTESSHKFDPTELQLMSSQSGFVCAEQWIDEEWPFVESLWMVPEEPSRQDEKDKSGY